MTNELKYTILAILSGLCMLGAIYGSFYIGSLFCLAGYSFWYMIGCLYAGMAVAFVFGHLMEKAISHIR